ncbi:uncharacterized protein [Canis lupus baileyi]|nr:uncharacterized protein LOC119868007 isoform X2 [Canis lupus familiaris]XP_038414763.1 uncharacterized protein LOC119868007 isoform X2 [Canis lupus familiaris]XP_038544352.1 uncharacterized protein LOC119868007 isoform X2 [Canis lupus familiaris]
MKFGAQAYRMVVIEHFRTTLGVHHSACPPQSPSPVLPIAHLPSGHRQFVLYRVAVQVCIPTSYARGSPFSTSSPTPAVSCFVVFSMDTDTLYKPSSDYRIRITMNSFLKELKNKASDKILTPPHGCALFLIQPRPQVCPGLSIPTHSAQVSSQGTSSWMPSPVPLGKVLQACPLRLHELPSPAASPVTALGRCTDDTAAPRRPWYQR